MRGERVGGGAEKIVGDVHYRWRGKLIHEEFGASAGGGERLGGGEPGGEIAGELFVPGGPEDAQEAGDGPVFFAEAQAGMRRLAGELARKAGFVEMVGCLDVDEALAGGVGVVKEAAEALFGGVRGEGEHGFGDEGAGEDEAQERAREFAGGGVVGFNGREQAGLMERAINGDDLAAHPCSRFDGFIAQVGDDGRNVVRAAEHEARAGAAGEFVGGGERLIGDGDGGADGEALPVKAAEGIVERKKSGGIACEDGEGIGSGHGVRVTDGRGVAEMVVNSREPGSESVRREGGGEMCVAL